MNEVRTRQRFAAHIGKNAAPGSVKPVDGALRRVLAHALHFIVEGPAVMAIEIALEFSEEIRDQRMEVTSSDPRVNVGKEPALHRMINLARSPLSLFGWNPVTAYINRPQQIRAL